jgi:molecular chaperone GrpE
MDEERNEEAVEAKANADPTEELEAQRKRIDELARAYADVLNEREAFRQRLERDRERPVESAKADVAQALFDALDELHRALAAEGQSVEGVLEGVQMIADGLHRRVLAMGIEPVPAKGHRFDPSVHEAIDLVPVPDSESDGMVVEQVRAGWRAGERVVRPARVLVGRFVPPVEAEEPG